jgi:hypothetical protein
VTISLITLLDTVWQIPVLVVALVLETARYTRISLMVERIASEMVVPEAPEP